MRKLLSIIMTSVLFIGIISPMSASAASKTYYYPVEGSSSLAPGIYKGTVNGKGKAVVKEKVYKLKELSKSPIKFDDIYGYYGKGSAAKKADYKNPYSLILFPIQDVQKSGKDLYYTKYLFEAQYFGWSCGGGVSEILEIYKRNSKGKVTKLVSDKVSNYSTEQIVVKDKYIYYAKVKHSPFSYYDIVRSTLDGKKKKTLKKSVGDFWVKGKYIYYVKEGSLYKMDMNGKNAKKVSKLKEELYVGGGCGPGNYTVTSNGIVVEDDKTVYFDFSTGKTTTLKGISVFGVLDVNVKKKRVLVAEWDEKKNKYTIASYNLSGKRLKYKTLSNDPSKGIISADANKGEVLYVSGPSLKKVKF